MLKVLHLVNSMALGGIETMLINIANNQSKEASVYVVVINDLFNETLMSRFNTKVHVIRNGRKVGSKSLIPFLRLNRTIKKINPDIIHLHNSKMWAYLIHPLIRCPICVTVHDVYNKQTDFRHLSHIKNIFAISNSVKQSIQKQKRLFSTVISNGIEVNALKVRENNNHTPFRIVQISRLIHERKGQHILLQAAAQLKSTYNFTVDFIGDGPSTKYLQQKTHDLNLTDRVFFLGEKSQEYIYKNLCNYDLLVQPSLFEGFGLTIVEAMAAKVPVLIADNPGPMAVIEKGRYGHLFTRKSVESCKIELKKILAEGYSQKMIDEARQIAIKKFDVKKTALNYLDEYKKIIQRRRHK